MMREIVTDTCRECGETYERWDNAQSTRCPACIESEKSERLALVRGAFWRYPEPKNRKAKQ